MPLLAIPPLAPPSGGEIVKKLKFSDSVWNLCLDVNVSYVGNILLSLYWKRNDVDEIYPFEEVRYFSRQLKWGRYKDVIFQSNTQVIQIKMNLPNFL